jgi:lysozyme family protein
MRAEYQRFYDTAQPRADVFAYTDTLVTGIGRGRARYVLAATGMRVPWQWIGIVHLMEGSLNFNTHLHNGDPLEARTVRTPAGRPRLGPPFTWEQSAVDALIYHDIHRVLDWDIPTMLFQFERWNGFGYRFRNVPSPYLWGGSQHYIRGKFIADGRYDASVVSKQIGAGVVLRRLLQVAPIPRQEVLVAT